MKKTRRQRIRAALLRLAAAYLAICALLFVLEEQIVFQPFKGPANPQEVGLSDYTLQHFIAQDGLNIPYWEHRNADRPLLLYFHGNGGGLFGFKQTLKYLREQGFAVAAMEYRGYPGAPGSPNEKALVADARAFYDHMRARHPNRPMILWGYSLGSGIAVQVAATRPISGLVLEAPFSAAVDVAKRMYPIIPVEWLMRNQFLSRESIGKVTAPVFMMHGEDDTIIPIGFSEQLYERANEPKQYHRYPQAGHMNLMQTPAYGEAVQFINALEN